MQVASAAIKAKRNCLYITSLSIFHYIATNSKNPLLKQADSRVAYVYMRAYIRAHAIKKPKQWNYVVIYNLKKYHTLCRLKGEKPSLGEALSPG